MSYHDLALFLAFIAVVAILLYRDRKKVKLQGIMFVRRTQRGREFIDKVARAAPRFWNFVGASGIVIGLLALVLISTFLVSNSVSIIQKPEQQQGIVFVLPGPTSEANLQPGLLLLPWWIWLIAVISVVVPHELAHGIMARVDKIRIKSVGWILLVIIPGAFVEPDEKQLKRAKRRVKLKVYAAGSAANILIAGIMLLVLSVSFNVMFEPTGTAFIANESSVFGKNMSGFILSIDGKDVSGTNEFRQIIARYKPGDSVRISVAENVRFMPKVRFTENLFGPVGMPDESNVTTYTVALQERPDGSGPYLGVAVPPVEGVKQNYAAFSLYSLMFWIFALNLFIGIFNMLPLKPLDGGLLFEETIGKYTKNAAKITKIVSIIMLVMLVFNFVGPIFLQML